MAASVLSAGLRDAVSLELLLEAVARGTPQRMRALGSSMWPTIPGGTELELHPVDPKAPPNPGAVVAVHARDGRFLIHRVCGLRRDGALLVKGDNCPSPDGWFFPGEVVAVVRRMDDGSGWREVPKTRAPVPPLSRRALGRLRRLAQQLSHRSPRRRPPH